MSEPTSSQLQKIVEILLDEYNKQNRTTYRWDITKSYQAKSSPEKWVDAIAYDKDDKPLKIQHKEIIWDIEYDKVRSNAADYLVNKLIDELIRYGLTEYNIHLNFYQKKIIREKNKVDEFCFWMCELVKAKYYDGYPKSYHFFLIPKNLSGWIRRLKSALKVFLNGIKESFYISLDKPLKVKQHIFSYEISDNIYIDHLKSITSSIRIFRNPGQKVPIVGWGYSELDPRPLPSFGERIISEVNHKIDYRYSNMLVALDCNRPIDEFDKNFVLSKIQDINFVGEIWLIENFANIQRANCIFKRY